MINTRRVTCGRSVSGIAVAAIFAALLGSTAFPAEARVIDRQRYSSVDQAHENICGRRFSIETTMTGTQMIKSSHGSLPFKLFDNYNIHEVLTDTAGEGFIIDQSGLYNDLRVRHARGTLFRFTAINAGQAFTTGRWRERRVERNRGVFQITYLVDTQGDSDPTNDVYLEETTRLVKDAGRHPIVNQTDAEYCAVVQTAIDG